jgi:hypothetical protein
VVGLSPKASAWATSASLRSSHLWRYDVLDASPAFGLKFPAEATGWGGFLLLISIQVYFWIHLREKSPLLTPTDPGLEVAWVGIYQSWAAQLVVFVTVVAWPAVGFLALTLRTTFSKHVSTQWLAIRVSSVLLLIATSVLTRRSTSCKLVMMANAKLLAMGPKRPCVIPSPSK